MTAVPVLDDGQKRDFDDSELTASERLIWTGQRLDPAAPLYNMALAIEIATAIDVPVFLRAFQRLVDETDALRTSFVEGEGRPRRVVRTRVPAHVEVLCLPESDADDASVMTVLEARTRRTFSLDEVLFDCCLVERRRDRFLWYLNQHHLITDAWSVGVLHRRMSALYEAALGHSPGVPAENTVSPHTTSFPQFAAFSRHHASLRGSPRLTRALAHWDAEAGQRNLPLYGNSEAGSGSTRRMRVRLGHERTVALRAASVAPPFRALTPEQSQFQLFATLLLAWLNRVSDSDRVAIGTPWHNRSTAAFRDTAGLFIELFPLRVTVDEGETFASLGAKVAARTIDVMRHVVPGASASPGARTFGVVLNYITARLGDFAGAPVRADWIHSGHGDRDHRVRLQVHDFDLAGDPVLDFDLDEAAFGELEREWAVRHFLALFDSLVADANRPIAAVPLSSWTEEATFAPRGSVSASPASPLSLVQESMRSAPNAVAVRDGGRRVTYEELDVSTRQLARRLRDAGVGREAVVGVALDRSAEMVIAMLAVLDAGGAFVPLDPAYPDSRLAFVVADSAASLVVTTPEKSERVRSWGATPLVIPSDPSAEHSSSPDGRFARDARPPGPDDLAYVLYTSGSTGQPKGVEVTHGSLADYVAWARRRYADGGRLTWPLFTSPAFDLTLTSIFVPLASEGTILIYPPDADAGALLVRRVFEDDQVDVVKLTPSAE